MTRRQLTAGLLLGLGLGGFVDGIVFHQLAQTHNLLSARLPPTTLAALEINMFWDGVFHAGTWLLTAAGAGMLWAAGAERPPAWPARAFAGALLVGWGLFNLVEGVLDHHLLGLHHVVHGRHQLLADLLFLGAGAAFVVIGLALMRSSRRQSAAAVERTL